MENYSEHHNIYFQQQGTMSLQCGRHSVNHLLGSNAYSQTDMNTICYELSDDFINPHKHIFGGDYDVNVLLIALERHQMSASWYDRRQGEISIPQNGQKKEVLGYLVNIFSDQGPGFLFRLCGFSRRHWISIRRVKDVWYWMDSKEQGPLLRNSEQTETELNKILKGNGNTEEHNEVLVVTRSG